MRSFKWIAGAGTMVLCALIVGSVVGGQAQTRERFGLGVPDGFLRNYRSFRAAQLASGAPQVLSVRLGFVKGLSRSFTGIAGEFSVDLESAAFRVTLNNLTPEQTYNVALVDGAETEGTPDVNVSLVTVRATTSTATATGALDGTAVTLPAGFTIDRIVVATGTTPPGEAVASGSLNVFQKVFFRRLSLRNEGAALTLLDETTPAPRFFNLVPEVAAANISAPRTVSVDELISRGATLFFQETFAGNGRTCGTCHPASNNFTIDPKFISTLPKNDPLFVAEFNPALAQLEQPKLMRQFGLILENLDGLDAPTTKFVMRGVPHTLGMRVSLEKDPAVGDNGPAQMTGWSGDGAPGTGSLRDFAIGAVTQHFTKRLARQAGRDFRLPTEAQLDAMEAFQLSLGRTDELILANITFQDANVQIGQNLFVSGTGRANALGSCGGFCHTNAGAIAATGQNLNFDTNVEDVPHPARKVLNFPKNGGFGQNANDGAFGNGAFNAASVVEAADTAPFFHNNIVNTLEEVVRFYSSATFNASVGNDPAFMFDFNATEVDQIADFMRGINVLQNIDVARRELREILENRGDPRSEQDTRLQTALEEAGDSIDVLRQGSIFPAAVTHLVAARTFVQQAHRASTALQRRALIALAIAKFFQAKNAVATLAS